MKHFLLTLALAVVSSFTLSAQKQVVINHDYIGFSGIAVSDNFEVSIVSSDSHSVRINAASSIEDYVQAYVKDYVLYLNIDEKSMPSELKKEFKAKNSIISTVNAEISMSSLASLTVNGNSAISSSDVLKTKKFRMKLSKSASVKSLNVVASASARLDVSGKSQTVMTLSASSIEIDASNNAKADIELKADKLEVSASSSAKIEVFGKAGSVSISSEGNAKVGYNVN